MNEIRRRGWSARAMSVRQSAARRRCAALAVSEALERRCLLSSTWYTVSGTGDDAGSSTGGNGNQSTPYVYTTLRGAITAALTDGGDDTIGFDSSFSVQKTITLSSMLPIINEPAGSLSIVGPGSGLLTISGNNACRIFFVEQGSFSISDMTLADGYAKGGSGGGGGLGAGGALFINGVYNGAQVTTSVAATDVVFSGNQAVGGSSTNGTGGGGLGGNGSGERGGGGFAGNGGYGGGGFSGNSTGDNSVGGSGGSGAGSPFGGSPAQGGTGDEDAGTGGGVGGGGGRGGGFDNGNPGSGGNGGIGGGGGGGGVNFSQVIGAAGNGGDFGGGGYGNNGGNGGFGGGGGFGDGSGGNGGFGGGGGYGYNANNTGGAGGYAAGSNSGGGAGLGGAIFIRSGSLKFNDSISFSDNSATGGARLFGTPGQGIAGAYFAVTSSLASQAGITTAPTVVVNGTFNVSGNTASNSDNISNLLPTPVLDTTIDDASTNDAVTAPVAPGTSVYDTASVTGSNGTPTGSITYYFYSTSTPDFGTTTPVTTQTVTLSPSGTVPNSPDTSTLSSGSYSYIAVYSGDADYNGVVSSVETLAVQQVPTLGSAIDNASGNTAVSGSVSLGASVYDTATVTGSAGAPAGSVTYYFYNTATPTYGTTTPVSSNTQTLSDTGAVPNSSTDGPLKAGSYSFIAVYSGGGNYTSAVSSAEAFAVSQGTPGVSSTVDDASTSSALAAKLPLGGSVSDTATVTGIPAFTPTGSVTYYFYNTAAPTFGTTTPANTQTVTLTNSGAVPNSSTAGPLAADSYAYIAAYSGDSNYAGSVGAAEPFTVAQGSPSVSTTIDDASSGQPISGPPALGASVEDAANVAGIPAFTPTGSVTYYFYNTATPTFGTTTPATTQTVTLTNAGAVPNSSTAGPLDAGNYSYIGAYSGDGNYASSVGAVEPLTVSKGNQTINVTAPPSPVPFFPNETINLSASGGPSGNPVLFSVDPSSTHGAGSISSNTLTITGAGNIVIDANQAGNSNYNPAAQVQQTVVVAGQGVTVVNNNTLYIVGSNTNDNVQVHHYGANKTGTTGVTVQGQLNGASVNKKYMQGFAAIYFYGFNGNDTFNMESSLTVPADVFAGNGNNTITLAGGNNLVMEADTASSGRANVQAGDGNNTITVGNAAKDQVRVGNGNNSITAGSGKQANIQFGIGNNTVTAGDGARDQVLENGDTITAVDAVTLGNGQQDVVNLGDGANTVTVGNGNQDEITAGNGNNVLVEGNGSMDTINAGNGDNLIVGGTGQHNLQAGDGSNMLIDGDVTLTQPGDTLASVLRAWITGGKSAAAAIRTRLQVMPYNTANANHLQAGRGVDWFFFKDESDQVNNKLGDLVN